MTPVRIGDHVALGQASGLLADRGCLVVPWCHSPGPTGAFVGRCSNVEERVIVRQSMGGVLLSPVFLPVHVLAGPSYQASILSMLLGGVDRLWGALPPPLAHWCAGGKVPNCPNRNF